MSPEPIVLSEGEEVIIDSMSVEVAETVGRASDVAKVTAENLQQASELLVAVDRQYKDAEKLQKELTKPLTDHAALIRSKFKVGLEKLDAVRQSLRRGIGAYNDQLERERRERERQERAALEAQQKAREEQDKKLAEAAGVEFKPPAPPEVYVPKQTVDVRTTSGAKVATRTLTKVKVTDIDQVPRRFLVVDETALNNELREAKRFADSRDWSFDVLKATFEKAIPGVEVYQESTVAVGR